jgi:hypothetical protein
MAKIQVIEELKAIRKELTSIRKSMVDKDMILTEDDYKALVETAKQKKKGELISLEEVEKDLGCL